MNRASILQVRLRQREHHEALPIRRQIRVERAIVEKLLVVPHPWLASGDKLATRALRASSGSPRRGVEKRRFSASGYTSAFANFGSRHRLKAAAVIKNGDNNHFPTAHRSRLRQLPVSLRVLKRKTGHPEAGRSDRVSENHRCNGRTGADASRGNRSMAGISTFTRTCRTALPPLAHARGGW